MESRTSPGKKGSVQPISVYPMGAFSRFSLVCTPVELVAIGSVHASPHR